MQWLHVSAKEYRAWGKETSSKYHAQKTVVDGVTYDSKKESRRAQELEYLEKIGKIKNLQRQVKFELIPSQRKSDGKIERGIAYIADFVYEDRTGKTIVEDVKTPATKTKEYLIKRKLMLYFHGIEIKEEV